MASTPFMESMQWIGRQPLVQAETDYRKEATKALVFELARAMDDSKQKKEDAANFDKAYPQLAGPPPNQPPLDSGPTPSMKAQFGPPAGPPPMSFMPPQPGPQAPMPGAPSMPMQGQGPVPASPQQPMPPPPGAPAGGAPPPGPAGAAPMPQGGPGMAPGGPPPGAGGAGAMPPPAPPQQGYTPIPGGQFAPGKPPPQQQAMDKLVGVMQKQVLDPSKLLDDMVKQGARPSDALRHIKQLEPLIKEHNEMVFKEKEIEIRAKEAGTRASREEAQRLEAIEREKIASRRADAAEKTADAAMKRADRPVKISIGGGGGADGKLSPNYRWSKEHPGTAEFIPGSAADPDVVAAKKQAIQLTGGRESVYTTRVMQAANQASKDLANIVKVPVENTTTGIFGGRHQGPGLFDAGKEVLAQKMTSQEAQTYNVMATGLQRTLAAVETSGLAQGIQEFSKSIDVVAKEGDTNLTKLHKLAQVRQILEAGLEPVLANPRVSKEEKKLVEKAIASVHASVPFTHSDLIELTARQEVNSDATLNDVLKSAKGGKGTTKPTDADNAWVKAHPEDAQKYKARFGIDAPK